MAADPTPSRGTRPEQGDGPWHPSLPQRLGRYRLVRKLGGGGMGIVFLARDEELDRNVAVKVVRPDEALLDEPHPRFQREVDAIARLHHQGIVTIHDAGFDAGLSWYAMEWIPGCTLSELLDAVRPGDPASLSGQDAKDQVISISESRLGRHPGSGKPAPGSTASGSILFAGDWAGFAFRVAERVAGALQHAHDHGVLHRDVKSSNIMVTSDGRVVLLDFGLAISEGEATITRSGVAIGSLPYMAPEQIHGWTSALDARTDGYGLGVTLYELTTLRQPFRSDSDETTRQRILSRSHPRPTTLNTRLSWDAETVIEVAMDEDPARRYPTASAFSDDLRRVLDGRPIDARRPGAILRLRRWVRTHPTWSAATVLSSVALLFLAWGLVTTREQAQDLQALVVESTKMNDMLLGMLQEETSILDAGMVQGRTLDLADLYEARRQAVDRFEGRPHLRARFLTYLARMARRLGRYDASRDHQQAALEIYERLAGDRDEAELAKTMNKLAEDVGRLGQLDRANDLCVRGLEMRERLFGAQSAEYADSLVSRALLEDLRGAIATSQSTLDAAVLILDRKEAIPPKGTVDRQVYGLDLALAYHRLGTSYLRSSRPEQAVRRLQRANALFDGVPNQRVHQAECRCHLALCALLMEEPEKALEHLGKAAEIRRQYLAPDDIIASQIKYEQGQAHWQQGERALAVKELRQAIAGFSREHIADRSKAPGVRVSLSYYLNELGKHDEAREQLRLAHAECEDVPDPIFAAGVEWALADLLESQGLIEEALSHRRPNIDVSEKSLGADHPRVITYRLTHARTFGLASNGRDAARLMTAVLDWCDGADPDTARFVTRSLGPLYATPVLAALLDESEIDAAVQLAIRIARTRFASELDINQVSKQGYLERLTEPFVEAGEEARARTIIRAGLQGG